MQLAAADALEISQESQATQCMYGVDDPVTHEYAANCLLARRLIERGARFVQVHTRSQYWDHHGRILSLLPESISVKAGGRGDVEPLWTQTAGSNVSSPVVAGDHLYWVSDRGIAHCLNRHTGEIVYQERLRGNRVEAYASALAADGKIYNVTRSSGTFVLAAKPQFELLASNVLDPDTSICNASPVVSNGQLLLRSNQALYCIGQPGR